MVTTTAQQVQELFSKAVRETAEVVKQTDALEREVRDFSLHALSTAIKATTPALKMVDQEHKITVTGKVEQRYIRGVALANPKDIGGKPIIISREGKVFFPGCWRDDPYHTEITPDSADFNQSFVWNMVSDSNGVSIAQAVIKVLDELAVTFAEAMRKNEARHAKLEELFNGLKAYPLFKQKEEGEAQ